MDTSGTHGKYVAPQVVSEKGSKVTESNEWIDKAGVQAVGIHGFEQATERDGYGVCWCGRIESNPLHLKKAMTGHNSNPTVVDMNMPITVLENGIQSAGEAIGYKKDELRKLQAVFDENRDRLANELQIAEVRLASYQAAIDKLRNG